jgi:class 3 adenylate cyclase/Tfp pilus assembly protein PilF
MKVFTSLNCIIYRLWGTNILKLVVGLHILGKKYNFWLKYKYLQFKYKLYIPILLLFLINPAFAQKQGKERVDSLVGEIAKAKEDTNKVNLLTYVSFAYQNINPREGIMYGEQGKELAINLDWKEGVADAYNAIGCNYRIKSDYPTALEYFFKALQINEEINDKQGIAHNVGNIGIVYKAQGDYNKALEYYNKALNIYQELGDKNGIGTNLGNIGIAYEMLKDYSKSLEYQNKALKLYEQIGNRRSVAHNLANIGLVYDDMGDYATALKYLTSAMAINDSLNNKKALANNHRGISSVYYHIATDTSGRYSGQRTEAVNNGIKYSKAGIAIATEIEDMKNLQDMHEQLSKLLVLSGDYKKALENYQAYIMYKDSIFSGKNSERIADLITKRELDIRDKEIQIRNKQIELDKLAVAKKRNERFFYIGGMILLIGVIIAIFKTNRLLIKEKAKSESLLLNILPSEVANELKETGTAAARHFDHVTILFTDFVNFTGASERMSSQELINELNTCFKQFDQIISKYNIEKIKTIGDAYLAVCGLPMPDSSHAEKVVMAASEILEYMQNRRKELGGQTFEIRVGIHSGDVVAGIVGVKKFAYDIWGDTVNTAARMEQNSRPGKINISETTYELIKAKFPSIYRGEIEVKNKGMMKMYFIETKVYEEELV